MKIHVTLTKSDKILALLNQWDPDGRCANGAGYNAYNYEAETIAQSIRSNSKAETVKNAVREMFQEADENEISQVAECIVAMMRKK